MIFPTYFFFFTTLILLTLGLLGSFLVKRNLILILVCVELVLVSSQLNFIISSYNFNDLIGQFFILFVLMIAAAEIAIGLALLIIYYRLRGTIDTNYLHLIKG